MAVKYTNLTKEKHGNIEIVAVVELVSHSILPIREILG